MTISRSVKLLSILFLLWACSASEPVVETPQTDQNQQITPVAQPEEKEPETPVFTLSDYRSQLRDTWSQQANTVPETFAYIPPVEEDEEQEVPIVTNAGFRIQIISTENRVAAEQTMARFNEWIFSNERIDYKALAYIQFRQPYYRVHVGDFTSRDEALDYNKSIKRTFRDAWVVHDKIDLLQIPSVVLDTTRVDSLGLPLDSLGNPKNPIQLPLDALVKPDSSKTGGDN